MQHTLFGVYSFDYIKVNHASYEIKALLHPDLFLMFYTVFLIRMQVLIKIAIIVLLLYSFYFNSIVNEFGKAITN